MWQSLGHSIVSVLVDLQKLLLSISVKQVVFLADFLFS